MAAQNRTIPLSNRAAAGGQQGRVRAVSSLDLFAPESPGVAAAASITSRPRSDLEAFPTEHTVHVRRHVGDEAHASPLAFRWGPVAVTFVALAIVTGILYIAIR